MPNPLMPKWLRWIVIPLGLLLVIALTLSLVDEPLRTYTEREINHRLPAYSVHIGALDMHPMSLSLDLEEVIVRQNDHPDPPIATVSKMHGSFQWSALLSGRFVTDLSIEHPVIHFTRPQASKELEASPVQKQSWQELLFAMQEVQLNDLRITNGDATYRETTTSAPLHLRELNIHAENIRNVRSAPSQYPSHLQIEMEVFDKGRLHLDGYADFFAEPSLAVNADATLIDITLADLLPLTAPRQVHLSQGILSAEGHVEYAPTVQQVRLKTLTVRDVKGDFVHTVKTQQKEKDTAQKVARAADKASNHPTLLLRIDRGKIEKSEFGLVNKSSDPPYRVFMTETDIELENWSNQLSEETAIVRLKGLLMGSGETHISGAFRPETESPDFDLSVKILRTPVKSLNQLLRAYGGIDVASGVFSVYSEMAVRNGKVKGYLKPIFKDVKAYDPTQDRDKGLLQKIFEQTINVAAQLLKNTPRDEVATKTDVSGPVKNPQASTWELVVTLFKNAFFEAVLPGLEGRLKK
ncbi:MAG: DUF748 domain-containing protein [Nitrospira sp.]